VNTAGDAHVDAWLELLGRLRAVLRQNLRDRVRRFEGVTVGFVPERLNFANTGQALLNKFSF
jgi:hypothetical protein